jgi:hypothetical protein
LSPQEAGFENDHGYYESWNCKKGGKKGGKGRGKGPWTGSSYKGHGKGWRQVPDGDRKEEVRDQK